MAIRLYELTGADDACRFSPYCWRVRLALAHKGLECEGIAWRFTEKEAIAASGQGRVPVLLDGDRVIHDSWAIADHLDHAYPDRPALFTAGAGRPLTMALKIWTERTVHPAISRMILADIADCLHEKDRAYFRESREKAFGTTLEALTADRDQALPAFRKLLDPLRVTLESWPFLGGDAPAYADYVVFGAFQWARVTSAFELLDPADPVHDWRERLLDLHDGLARRTPARR